jgi:hypothetical protein
MMRYDPEERNKTKSALKYFTAHAQLSENANLYDSPNRASNQPHESRPLASQTLLSIELNAVFFTIARISIKLNSVEFIIHLIIIIIGS